MQNEYEHDYRYTLIFPSAQTYAVDDVLRFMAVGAYLHTHPQHVEPAPLRPWLGNGKEANDNFDTLGREAPPKIHAQGLGQPDPQTSQANYQLYLTFVQNHKLYLIDRLLKAVKEKKFELWNSAGDKVLEPPDLSSPKSQAETPTMISADALADILNRRTPLVNEGALTSQPVPQHSQFATALGNMPSNHRPVYRTPLWWATMGFMFRKDLIRFCNDERIEAVFESQIPQEQLGSAPQGANTVPEIDCLAPAQQAKVEGSIDTHRVNSSTETGGFIDIDTIEKLLPGKLPKVTIGKLAVIAAWEIERESGKRATSPATIKRLQKWAVDERHESLAKEITASGVKWTPMRKINPKGYDVEACEKTLETWFKSRA